MAHGRVISRNHRLCDQAHQGKVQAGGVQFVVQRLAKQVADFALGGGSAHVQGQAGNLVGGALGAQQVGADLRAVAVGDHQAIAVANQADDGGGGAAGIAQLFGNSSLLPRADEGIAADSYQHCAWHGHFHG